MKRGLLVHTLYHLARADFLERVRRYSFLLVLAATIYLGYSINRGEFHLELDNYRGLLNSAWVGGMMAASAVLMLSLFGFYLVKNAVDRDMRTGVGQIIATTPISRPVYLLGKWLSNSAVLIALVAILALAAVVMQLLGGESARLELWPLLAPFLLLALPSMLLVAGMALFFESIAWLRGGLGNVLYFFVWVFGLIAALESKTIWMDWSGIYIVWQSMGEALRQVYPNYGTGFNFTFTAPVGELQTFTWSGIHWTAGILLSRLAWLGGTVALVFAGALFFHRFDPSREWTRPPRLAASKRKLRSKTASGESPDGEEAEAVLPAAVHSTARETARLGFAPFASWLMRFNFVAVLAAELRLLLKGLPGWWYLVASGLVLASFFSPLASVQRGILPAAWIWPVLLWSKLGCREASHNTRQIVFSAPHPLSSQLGPIWLAGFIVTALMGSGAAVRLGLAGDLPGLLAWLAGAVFIPSLALSLGVWTGSSKAFEIVYVLLWYLGPANGMVSLNFIPTGAGGPWPAFALAGAGLLLAAWLGRWFQLRER